MIYWKREDTRSAGADFFYAWHEGLMTWSAIVVDNSEDVILHARWPNDYVTFVCVGVPYLNGLVTRSSYDLLSVA